jgi:putative membrane protein
MHIAIVISSLNHGLRKLGTRNILIFFLITTSIPLITELIWTSTGILGEYYYTDLFGPKIFDLVPFLIPIVWFELMYITKTFTDFIFGAVNPHYFNNPVLLAVFDSIALTTLDLSLDPIFTMHISWYVWLNGGEYVGIPLTNYLGWFIICFISFTTFRLFEFINPQKNKIHNKLIRTSFSFTYILNKLTSTDSAYILLDLVAILVLYLLGINLAVIVSLIATSPFILLWLFVILGK